MATPTLAYWNIRGLGQVPRLILRYAGVAFEDKQYEDDSWYQDKARLGPFANLPYLLEPGLPFPLFESKAIIQHLGRAHGLYGESLAEQARIDEIIFHVEDIRSANARVAYGSKEAWARDSATYKASLPGKFASVEKHLAARPASQKWVASNKVSTADFFLYEVVDTLLLVNPDLLQTLPHVRAHHDAVRDLPAIRDYIASPAFPKRVNGEEANF